MVRCSPCGGSGAKLAVCTQASELEELLRTTPGYQGGAVLRISDDGASEDFTLETVPPAAP